MLASMIEVLAGEFVITAKKSSPHTSADDMEESGLVGRSDLDAWIIHAASIAEVKAMGNRKIARRRLGNLLGLLGVQSY